MKKISSALVEVSHSFFCAQIPHANREARYLLCDLLHCSLGDLLEMTDRSLTDEQWLRCEEWMRRRIAGEPLAYIAGEVSFYHCKFFVNSHVLIPRPETEILVDLIVNDIKHKDLQGKVLWDLCTGSGCIGISLKKQFPFLHVVLSDISGDAIAIAQENAIRNGVVVDVIQGDLLAPFHDQKAHYIVCNPPYIAQDEIASLDSSVKDFEPRIALEGGKTGLEFYQRLALDLPNHLYPHAKVWLEIGFEQGQAIKKIFNSNVWKHVSMQNDWSSRNRFFFLENE